MKWIWAGAGVGIIFLTYSYFGYPFSAKDPNTGQNVIGNKASILGYAIGAGLIAFAFGPPKWFKI